MHPWVAERTKTFDASGIRKVFDLAARLKNPINLSIGQPDFDVPEAIQIACIDAIRSRRNSYAPTQGISELRQKLQLRVDAEYQHADRSVFVSSGTSGGLVLALLSLVNPGDEVIFFDPYFVMYEALVKLVGGVPVVIDTYPDFRIDADKVAAAITPRTKLILLNSPANPTGVVVAERDIQALAELAAIRNIALISDELYRIFLYDEPFVSPARFNRDTIVIDGFSKSHAMTGWRLGFVHGPAEIMNTMIKLQQYTFVCAPQPVQWAGIAAMDVDMSDHVADYRRKRDRICAGLEGVYEFVRPGGAFYLFPRAPGGNGTEFVTRALDQELLVIPGGIFSHRDTHFRISFAAADETIERGIAALLRLATGPSGATG
ncbi:MAG: aminotransferase class I/II-fold pyridoxal phosphate-dependent enzyme [Planctomycetes bacterium]|nr:aminotransferase class I/II-fold pyridoxal phosphate-dependent enzyme [Planctomycetota bacterium]